MVEIYPRARPPLAWSAVAADAPTILATSGGLRPAVRTAFAFGPLITHAIELSGVSGRRPRLCHVGTATGDQAHWAGWWNEAGRAARVEVTHLNLFPMPNLEDPLAHLLDQDVIWVGGGSVANLLALWRLHGLDRILEQAWRAGVVMAGVSAGSLCWHVGGTTDSFGPDLRPVTNGLGWLPYSNGVHYDAEEQRRPLLHRLVSEGTLPDGYATDNGAGLIYRGTEMVEAVTEVGTAAAYSVRRARDAAGNEGAGAGRGVVEHRLDTRRLPGAR
jgi:peptidase E